MRNSIRIGILVLGLAIGLAGGAQARQGGFIGVGLAGISASGDLDGNHVATDLTTEVEVAGKLGSGGGLFLNGGYGANAYLGFEILFSASSHTATSNLGGPVPPSTTATVGLLLLGVRLTVPVSDNFDLFARLGIGSSVVTYKDYSISLLGGANGNATFSGGATGYGLGMEFVGEHVGVEFGYTLFNASIDKASGTHLNGTFSPAIKETFSVADLAITYHFQ
jgi:hypothetical protein